MLGMLRTTDLVEELLANAIIAKSAKPCLYRMLSSSHNLGSGCPGNNIRASVCQGRKTAVPSDLFFELCPH